MVTTRLRRAPHLTAQHSVWLLAILVAAFALRAADLQFNSAFEGESFMILMGRSVLAGASDVASYMRTAFGWYLWPVTTALSDRMGGLLVVRLLAATLGTAAVGGVFLFTRRLFDERTALVAALFCAVFTPAVLASRIATPDAAGMALLAFTLAAYTRAAQTSSWRAWLAAAALAIVCVLVKHSLAAIVPPLCLLAPFLDRRRGSAFLLIVVSALAAYTLWYVGVLREMLASVAGSASLRAGNEELIQLYVRNGLDVWLLGLCVLAAFVRGNRDTRLVVGALAASALALAVVPASRTFDPHSWSQTVYPVILLLPAAAAGALGLADRLVRHDRSLASLLMLLTAGSLFLLSGDGLTPMKGGLPVVWPNTTVVADFLQTRVQYGQRVLVDDAAVRYLLAELTPQDHVTDERATQLDGAATPAAFARAVANGYFDYVVLDGNNTEAARAMQEAVEPVIAARYAERLRALQPNTGFDAVVYERISPPVTRPSDAPTIVVNSPHSGDTIVAGGKDPSTIIAGRVLQPVRGAKLRFEVHTDSWYAQGEPLAPTASGNFARRVVLGGQGAHRCAHLVRVRLMGADERILHEVVISGLHRTTADSVAVRCEGG